MWAGWEEPIGIMGAALITGAFGLTTVLVTRRIQRRVQARNEAEHGVTASKLDEVLRNQLLDREHVQELRQDMRDLRREVTADREEVRALHRRQSDVANQLAFVTEQLAEHVERSIRDPN